MRVYGQRAGSRRARTSLLLAKNGEKLLAPMLFEGTCNHHIFNAWVRRRLLRALPKKALVILDNAAFHKHPSTRQLIESKGHVLLFLAPYSPDLNPVERTFASIKAFRRKTQLQPDALMFSYLGD